MPQDNDSSLIRRLGKRIGRFLSPTLTTYNMSLGKGDKEMKGSTAAARGGSAARSKQSFLQTTFADAADRTRLARYSDYREMREEVPELAQSLAVIVAFTFSTESKASGLRLRFSSSARDEVKNICLKTWGNLDFNSLGPAVLSEGGQMGDSFSELIYNRKGDLIAEKALIPEWVKIIWDDYGRLTGYEVTPNGINSNVPGGQSVKLHPWEVAHYAPDRERNNKYGTSFWQSARKLWSAEQTTLDVLSILTILRAASRKSVAYPVPNETDAEGMEAWVEKLSQGNWIDYIFDSNGRVRRRISALLEMDDNIYPFRAGGEAPKFHNEQSADLRQVIDVLKYYQDRYFVVTGVPAGLAGLERNINARSTLEQQAKNFVRMITKRQEEMRRYLEGILHLALAAKRITPMAGEFFIEFPDIATFDQKTIADTAWVNAQTVNMLSERGYDQEYLAVKYMGVDPKEVEAAFGGGYDPEAPEVDVEDEPEVDVDTEGDV